MKVEKLIKAEIPREYYFIKGKMPIDTKYFIRKITEGTNLNTNMNYKTNVVGTMTAFNFFLNDKKFIKLMMPIFDIIDSNPSKEVNVWKLTEAWGFKEKFSDYTRQHAHLPCFL